MRHVTCSKVDTQALGYKDDEHFEYSTVSYTAIARALQRVPRNSFLDLGCRKGRPLLVASRLGFAKVRGVELSPRLAEIARRNLGARAEVICGDASTYAIPGDVTVAYLANPFGGETLRKVLGNLLTSNVKYLVCLNMRLNARYISGGLYYPGNFPWAIYDITAGIGLAHRGGSDGIMPM